LNTPIATGNDSAVIEPMLEKHREVLLQQADDLAAAGDHYP
jgi:hypothetical protein